MRIDDLNGLDAENISLFNTAFSGRYLFFVKID